jgi:hypothetical protein
MAWFGEAELAFGIGLCLAAEGPGEVGEGRLASALWIDHGDAALHDDAVQRPLSGAGNGHVNAAIAVPATADRSLLAVGSKGTPSRLGAKQDKDGESAAQAERIRVCPRMNTM